MQSTVSVSKVPVKICTKFCDSVLWFCCCLLSFKVSCSQWSRKILLSYFTDADVYIKIVGQLSAGSRLGFAGRAGTEDGNLSRTLLPIVDVVC